MQQATQPVEHDNATTTSSRATPESCPEQRTPARPATSRRGQQASHLLGFQYQQAADLARRGRGGGDRGMNPARRHHSSRNKFLQANYRFLVSDAVDADQHHRDADHMFDWQDVLEVELLTSVPVQCPISLDQPPVCPQITRCGHIYAFASIVQHLAHQGQACAPCPLCFEPVVMRDLRLVRITHVTPPQVGGQVTFQLLKRSRTSIMPEPVRQGPALTPAAAQTASEGEHTGGGRCLVEAREAGGQGQGDRNRDKGVGTWGQGPTTGSGAGAAPKRKGQVQGDRDTGGPSGPDTGDPPHPLAVNRFVKFALVGPSGATTLWRAAAKQLAEHADEVVREGGPDAAAAGPFIFMSLEQLAARARRWVTHRAQQLVERAANMAAARAAGAGASGARAVVLGGEAALDPEAQGAAAEEAVKKMFTAAVQSNSQQAAKAKQHAALERQFPQLAVGSVRGSTAAGPGPPAVGSSTAWPGLPPITAVPPPALTSGSAAGAPAQPLVPPVTPAGQALAQPSSSCSAAGGPVAASFSGHQAADAAPAPSVPTGLSSSCDSVLPLDGGAVPETSGLGPYAHTGGELHATSAAPETEDTQNQLQGAAAPAAATSMAGERVRGLSPGGLAAATTSNSSSMTQGPGDLFVYQATDGQYAFLDPLCVRCLLAHYGDYESCPATLTAPVLEVERVDQSDATRKRWRFLAHLPLNATFFFLEVSLTQVLPRTALQPFMEEITARDKRRKRRQRTEQRAAEAAATAARLQLAACRGPSAYELAAMPALAGPALAAATSAQTAVHAAAGPPPEAQALRSALEEGVASQAAVDAAADGGDSASSSGVSFAQMARLGYAATGPTLGSSPPTAAGVTPQGVWAKGAANGRNGSGTPAPAGGASGGAGGPRAEAGVNSAGGAQSSRRAKNKGVLLFTSGQPRASA